MKIIIIPSWYNSKSRPTLGSFFKEQAEALSRHGHEVIILYPGLISSRDLFKSTLWIKNYMENDVNVYRFDTPACGINKIQILEKKIWEIKTRILYKRIVKIHGKPDIIHAHCCLWAGVSALRVLGKEDVPIFITEHSTAFQKNEITGLKRRSVEYCMKNANGIISVSNNLKEILYNFNPTNRDIKVIPNMFNSHLSKDILERESSRKAKFQFLSICYLTHKKGIDILIKAFDEAFANNEDVELIIGGDGEELNSLIELRDSLGLQDKVHFIGPLNREDVLLKMSECSVFVLPSRFETFGIVFIEALSLGKPVIASKAGGPNDIVNSENGLLVEIEDISGLANAMISLKENYTRYNSSKIMGDCYYKFSEQSVVKQLEQYYYKIKNGGKNDHS